MTFEEPRLKEGDLVTVSREGLKGRQDLEPVIDKVGALCELSEDNTWAEVVFEITCVDGRSPSVNVFTIETTYLNKFQTSTLEWSSAFGDLKVSLSEWSYGEPRRRCSAERFSCS
jgi:hypothetical protein